MFKAFIEASENHFGDLDLLCSFRPSKHRRKDKKEKSILQEPCSEYGNIPDEEISDNSLDNDDELNDFFNGHMADLQGIIAQTAEQINPSEYKDQQKYFLAVFEQASEDCWQYIKDIKENGKEEIKPNVLQKLTEEEVKETAMAITTTFFIQLAILNLEED